MSEFIDDYSIAEYSYNINGLRESKTVNGIKTRYIYNGADIIGEIFDDNIYTYYRGTELIGYTHNKGDRYYYRQNSHGDVTALLTVDGQEKKTYSYNAYGKENPLTLFPMGNQTVVQLWRAETEQIHNPFRYCGEYQDAETGLIYLRNRYYDNSIGRFITKDPIKDGLNWYAYCGNNPVMYVDPWGLEYVVVSGSENNTLIDRRYKYNFIEPAIKKLRELKALNDGENITWLISSTGYSADDINNFKNTAAEIGVNISFFGNKQEFASYINSKGVVGDTSLRDSDKIRKIAVFSHGLIGSIEFGYHQRNQKDLSFGISDINLIRTEAFDNPNSCFYSCNTATPNEYGATFAQAWVNKVRGKTWAVYEKTDYAKINNLDNWKTVIKPERKATGYRQSGSDYYPIPSQSRNAYWKTFTHNVRFSAG